MFDVAGAPPDLGKSTVDLVGLGHRRGDSSSSVASSSTAETAQRSGYAPDDTEDSGDDRDAIGDLLDEAMDSEKEEEEKMSPVQMVR